MTTLEPKCEDSAEEGKKIIGKALFSRSRSQNEQNVTNYRRMAASTSSPRGRRSFAYHFLVVGDLCVRNSARGRSRSGIRKVRRKCAHNAHPRAGIGGRSLGRKPKNDRKFIVSGVPVSAIEMISPSKFRYRCPLGRLYYLYRPSGHRENYVCLVLYLL